MLLTACVAVAVVAPLVMLGYPIPQIRGGWCQSGGRPGHYTVETIAKVALWGESLAVSFAFIAVMLGLACWRFSVKDY